MALKRVKYNFRFQGGPFNPYHPYSFSACGMGGPGFYGPMGTVDEGPLNLETSAYESLNTNKFEGEDFKKDDSDSDGKKENHGPTREAFMDPDFGGFYDDLAAGPPSENLSPGDRPFEKGMILQILA